MTAPIPIVIPAYQPDGRLQQLLQQLCQWQNTPIVVVNDGSSPEYAPILNGVQRLLEAHGGVLLHHKTNLGKGAALKTGFEYLLAHCPNMLGCVCADCDGQHTPRDIQGVVDTLRQNPQALVLGVRNFGQRRAPMLAKVGNAVTRRVFAFVAGQRVRDLATGLRGVPRQLMQQCLDISTDHFEFEMQQLLNCAGRRQIVEVPVETLYWGEGHTHFDPVRDSAKIYRVLMADFAVFLFSSLTATALDMVLFWLFCGWFAPYLGSLYAAGATGAARVFSSLYSYTFNYKFVFHNHRWQAATMRRYVLLVAVQLTLSASLVTVLVHLLPTVAEVLLKICVDGVLFFGNYYLQRRYVFSPKG